MDMDLKGKKLLILAGAKVHCKIVDTAQKMGVYTIVTDNVEDSPAKKIADEHWLLDIFDVDGIVERCRQNKVDGVITFSIDPAQRPYQEICEKLNLPSYYTKEQVNIMTDKSLFKKLCLQNEVNIIPEYDESDVINNLVDYPLLVKPTISRGSRGQTVCYKQEDVWGALINAREESRDGNAIIEKYITGKQDFTLSYLVIDGIPYKTKIGDRYLGRQEDNLDKQCIATVSPSMYTNTYINNIETSVKKMVKSLGISFGPVFLQGFIDEDTVRFYDPGLRFPGGDFDLILRDSTGFDTMKSMIYFALTGDEKFCFGNPDDAFRINGNIGVQLTLSARPGVIRTYDGLEDIVKLADVISVSERSYVGAEIPASGDIRQRVIEITVLANNKISAKETIKDIYSKLNIVDEEGQNMLVSLFDIDFLDLY